MSNGLSTRDLEWVSAYLDNALPSQERAAFEQRLEAEPDLSDALKQLERTRALLRRAPQRRVPRSFALRADMVAAPRKAAAGGWNSWNLVSAATTLVLVLVFAGEIWASGMPLFGVAAPAAEEAPQAMMAQESAEDLTVTPTPTDSATEGAEEIELYAEQDQGDRNTKEAGPFDLRLFLADYARPLEFSLAILAIGAGLFAWWRRRNP